MKLLWAKWSRWCHRIRHNFRGHEDVTHGTTLPETTIRLTTWIGCECGASFYGKDLTDVGSDGDLLRLLAVMVDTDLDELTLVINDSYWDSSFSWGELLADIAHMVAVRYDDGDTSRVVTSFDHGIETYRDQAASLHEKGRGVIH